MSFNKNAPVELEITDWNARPDLLFVKVEIPALPLFGNGYYRRRARSQDNTGEWGWYCSLDGSLPDQGNGLNGFAAVMDQLVMQHEVLGDICHAYDI